MTKHSYLVLIIVLILALASSALFALLIYRTYADNLEAEALSTELGLKGSAERSLQMARALQKTNKSDFAALDEVAVSEHGVAAVIDLVEKAADETNLSGKVISVEKVPAADTTPLGVRLTFEGTGAWRSAYLFLRAAESVPYRVTLEEASLTRGDAAWQAHVILFIPTFQ